MVDLIWFCVVDFLLLRGWLTTQFWVLNFPLCFAQSTPGYLPLKHHCTATSRWYQHLTTLFLICFHGFHLFYLFLIHSGCYELIPSTFPGRLPSPDLLVGFFPDLPVGFPFQISQSAPIKAQLLVDTTHIWLLYFSHFISLILSLFNSFWLPWAYTLYNLCFARSAFLARFPWAYTSHNLCFARSAFFTRFPDRISNRESLSQPPVDLTALFFILLLSILFISSLFNSFWWLWAYSLCFSPVGIPLQISWLSRRRRY